MPLVWSEVPENREFEEEMNSLIEFEGLVLDVGCGDQKLAPNLLGVDAYSEAPEVNVKAYMWDMPFDDESIDGIICLEALEHVSKYQVLPTLEEFQRVLKPGAKLIILVPNLVWVLEEFLKNPNYGWELDTIFGTQTNEGQMHRTGFTLKFLDDYFKAAAPKLTIIKTYDVWAYSQQNFGIIAIKEQEKA